MISSLTLQRYGSASCGQNYLKRNLRGFRVPHRLSKNCPNDQLTQLHSKRSTFEHLEIPMFETTAQLQRIIKKQASHSLPCIAANRSLLKLRGHSLSHSLRHQAGSDHRSVTDREHVCSAFASGRDDLRRVDFTESFRRQSVAEQLAHARLQPEDRLLRRSLEKKIGTSVSSFPSKETLC